MTVGYLEVLEKCRKCGNDFSRRTQSEKCPHKFIDGVKMILKAHFKKELFGLDAEYIAQQICQLMDAECQARVERIIQEIEHFASLAPNGDIIEILLDGNWWQALKKQEGVENGS